MLKFLSSSAASLSASPSITGASSLVSLLIRSSTLNPTYLNTCLGIGTIDSCDMNLMSKSGGADKFRFADFVLLVRNAPASLRALPVTIIESYQNDGLVPHRYSIVTIHHPHGESTHIKLQRTVEGTFASASALAAELADDRSALVPTCDHRLAALEFMPGHASHEPPGPTLDALAELLDIIHKRAGRYNLCSRNCFWLVDLILFGSAMRFGEIWLAKGRVYPDRPIRKYLRREMDVLAASMLCFLPEGAPEWMGIAYGVLGRVFGVFAFDMQREVEDVVGRWEGYVDVISSSASPWDAITQQRWKFFRIVVYFLSALFLLFEVPRAFH